MSVPELSLNGQVIDHRSFTASAGAYYSSVLNLKTQEGDRVNLSFNSEQSYSETHSETRLAGNVTVQEFSSTAVAASRYSISVAGDLNEGELAAIQKLTQEISPIARSFFNDGEFNVDKAKETLAGNLGVIQELELALEKIKTTTVSAEKISPPPVDQGAVPDPQLPQVPEVPKDVPAIRKLPELVFAALDAEFEAQTVTDGTDQSILKTLSDLLKFIHEKLGPVLEPLSHQDTTPEADQPNADSPPPEPQQA